MFKLTGPDSAWTIDVKNGKGSVTAGAGSEADCTLELTDADFLAMTSGKADAMKLYMGGKLKISGDVMASQKLSFLQKIDPKHALEAVMKKRGGGAAAAPAAATASTAPAAGASAATATAPALFKALGERLAKNPGLAKEFGAVLQFNVTNPKASWVVDLTGAGAVSEGTEAKAHGGAAHRRRGPRGSVQGPGTRPRSLPTRQAAGRRRCSHRPQARIPQGPDLKAVMRWLDE